MQNILLIDDDSDYCEAAKMVLLEEDCAVWEAQSPAEAFELLFSGERFDLILCDLHMPFTEGAEQQDYQISPEVGYRTAKELAWALPGVPLVVLSALPPSDLRRLTPHMYPIPILSKPASPGELLGIIEAALESAGAC